MTNVVDFPGITYGDVDAKDVLEAAKDCDEVVVVGWKGDDLYLAMSQSKIADSMLLVRCADRLMMDTLLAMSEMDA